ncbi:aromatic-ring-hydroxylating dioxygenase subunit beta [Bradyrhizobium tropiciagri]|uniref:aromatic-ring-hydroxylating dioxygenase subunit beta n=1 Tax=Bradyrhizobium tropiciagri TaxID=312253 RepID=UPI001BA5F1EE|nr:aromatic-ring-hydroxylating dioxygenase subunit beta [Bradyrhizobium tropiciagri]MBR0870271.1 aromatic-ring-hydroxylating dioxygenase subunit beta [Bradyrhizobium tropiciagri]
MHVTDTTALINHVQNAYVRCIDSGNLEAWPDFFEDDCVYKITTADNFAQGLEAGVIFANSKGMLRDRVASLREANIYERHVYRHFLGQAWIVSESADQVRSETSFFVARIMRDGTTDVYATGRYIDSYRMNGREPRLRERIVVCDSSRFDTLLALPL